MTRHGHPATHYLKPGEMLLSRVPSLITTVLGSCISITMHHKPTGLSIICHAVMPVREESRNKREDGKDIFQFVDSSIEWMVSQYEKTHIRPSALEVKMFGGAAMFSTGDSAVIDIGVGKRNIETALEILGSHAIELKAWNMGGNQGRKLIFNTLTGDVLTRFITKAAVYREIDSRGKK